MTCARHLFVADSAVGTYHCVSRCVRRAWLCGVDAYTGIDYSHRKVLVEQRLALLCEVFAAGLYGYAVMSNHLHVVLRIDPDQSRLWTDHDLASRWCRLFPARNVDEQALKVQHLQQQPERLALLRQRLACLSWFMRCLNEPIARLANTEDQCTGRFWEGRFKCQALLDDRAVLTALAYVDLNPIRAGITTRLDHSTHTSIQTRVLDCRRHDQHRQLPLIPLLGIGPALPLSQGAYIDLVQWAGQQLRPGKRGAIPKNAPPALSQTGCNEKHWPTQVKSVGSGYWRVIGSARQMMEKAEQLGQRWLKGIGLARRFETD